MEKKLTIEHFTDPFCFWCYAMEPETRKLRVLLGEQADYHIVMGVLSSDVHELIGYDAESEVRYEFFRALMADRLNEAAKAVGMPLSMISLFSRDPEELVSLPLSMAYCAMRSIDEDIAEAYLRRMREIIFAEGRNLSSVDRQVELAAEFPIDVEQFRANLEDGTAADVLQEGVDKCQEHGIVAFPSLLIRYEDRLAAIHGYHGFEEFRQVIAQLTEGDITLSEAEFSTHALEAYVDRWGKVAAREIQVMFSFNEAQLANAMMDLVSTGRYKTETCGSSYFVMPK